MKNKASNLLCCIGLVICCNVQAADLWDIYELALANDPTYQAATFSLEAEKINLPLAKTRFKSTLNSGAQLGKQRSDISGLSRNTDDNSLNLNFVLPLYDLVKRTEIIQVKYQLSIAELQLLDAKHDLMIKVAQRYFNILAAQDAREVTRLEKIAIKRQMDLANERLEVGLGTRTDLFDAKARFKLSEANEIQAQNQINNDIAILKQLIGITPEALDALSDNAPLDLPVPNSVGDWIEQSYESNIPLQIQNHNLNIALEEIDKLRNSRRPTLNLTASHRYVDSGNNFSSASSGIAVSGDTNTSSIGLELSFPLYQGGAIKLLTQQAGYLYNRSERELEEARRLASTTTTTAYLDVTSGVSQVEALFDAIIAGESALEAREEGFSAGLTTNLDVLDAQRDLSQSRTDYLRARYNYIISVLELERAAGQLDEEDMKRVNSWLQKS